MSEGLGKYLFVFDDRERTFPERWRILRHGDPADVADIGELSGTIHEANVPKMRRRFEAEYTKPRYDISTAWANTWISVCNNYRGLRDRDEYPAGVGTASDPPAAKSRTPNPERIPTRRSSALGSRRESSRWSNKWTGPLLCLYVLAAMVGAAALAHALSGLPSEFPLFELSDDTDVQAEANRVREWVATEVPTAADWLAPMGLFNFEDDLRSVLEPNDWELANVTLEDRVERLNHSITGIRADFLNATSLLGVIFFGGLAFACLTLLQPSVGTAFILCLFPIFATPVATEPLIGVDNMSLFYLTLPMLITGGAVLLIEITRGIGTSVTGPRSEAWMRVWAGLGLILIGAAATTVGVLLAKATNAGVMAVAVGPVLYGVFSVIWGIVGLFKRRGIPWRV